MKQENKKLQISGIRLTSLQNDAHFIYMKDVEKRLETDSAVSATAEIKALVDVLKKAISEEDNFFILSKKSQYTELINAKDKERNKLFRSYKMIVKGMRHFPVVKQSEAANVLWQHLKDYKINPDMQLERETSRIMNLVDDINTKYAEHVKTLGLKPYADALKAANDEVENLLLTRTEERSKQTPGILRKSRKVTDDAYHKVVDLINATVVVGTDKDFAPLINNMNENIKRYKEKVMTHRKKDELKPEIPLSKQNDEEVKAVDKLDKATKEVAKPNDNLIKAKNEEVKPDDKLIKTKSEEAKPDDKLVKAKTEDTPLAHDTE